MKSVTPRSSLHIPMPDGATPPREAILLSATYSRIGAMVPILKALGLPADGVSVTIKIDAGMPRVEVIKLIDTDTAQALATELKNYSLVPREE